MRGCTRGFLRRCGCAAAGTGAERRVYVCPGSFREQLPEKVLPVMLVVVF
jgi:hypothetical protein